MRPTSAERIALTALGIDPATISRTGDTLTIPVAQTLDGQAVTVRLPRAELLAWCERRLETRARHKNRAICGGGGQPAHHKAAR